MANSLLSRHRPTKPLLAYALMFCVLGSAYVGSEVHAAVVTGSYTLDIAENDRVLNAMGTPEYNTVVMEEHCDNPHIRIYARNTPAIQLKNDAGSDGDITSFTLRITNSDFNFGVGDFISSPFDDFIQMSPYNDAGVNLTGSTLTDNGRLITVNFTGLAPGSTALFRVDLDAIDPNAFQFPDFRQVLQGLDGNGQPGGGSTGQAGVTFSMGDMSTTTDPMSLPAAAATTFINGNIRPYSAAGEDLIIPASTGDSTIPEPSGLVLLAIGALSLLRQRRSL